MAESISEDLNSKSSKADYNGRINFGRSNYLNHSSTGKDYSSEIKHYKKLPSVDDQGDVMHKDSRIEAQN